MLRKRDRVPRSHPGTRRAFGTRLGQGWVKVAREPQEVTPKGPEPEIALLEGDEQVHAWMRSRY